MGRCLFMRKGEVHTNPGARLPSGYTELAYIQSIGSQYINTGFKPNQDTKTVIDIEATGISGTHSPFGCRAQASGTDPKAYIVFFTNSTTFRSDYFGTTVKSTVSTVLQREVIKKDKNVCSGFGVTLENTASTGQATLDMYLMCENDQGTATFFVTGKLYSCQIYDNDILVRDFTPCINASGEVGLYDLVGKQFYGNAGTGTFTGSEVA